MRGKGPKRTGKQELAAIALLTEPTIKAAAEKVGIEEATLFRWLQEKEFKKLCREVKRQAVSQATARLQQSTTLAVDTLRAVMKNPKHGSMARISAAKTVLEMAYKAIELEDVMERLEALESDSEDSDDNFIVRGAGT